jgi:hypothetical protein
MSLVPLIVSLTLPFGQAPAPSQAEVFGLREGQTIASLGLTASPLGSQFYPLASVPKPEADFVRYYVIAGEKTGICAVTAIASPFADDPRGIAVRDQMAAFARRMEAEYGPSAEIQRLRENAQWTREDDWVMAIHEGELEYQFHWPARRGTTPPVAGIASISLIATAQGPDRAGMVLQINFDNMTECESEKAAFKIPK